MRSVGTHIRS